MNLESYEFLCMQKNEMGYNSERLKTLKFAKFLHPVTDLAQIFSNHHQRMSLVDLL